MNQKDSRPNLFKGAAAAGAALGAFTILGATAKGQGKGFKVGLIGCGGRGNGALGNHMAAAKQVGLENTVVATCDYFKGKAEATGGKYGVPKEKCFGTANGYKDFLATDVEIVLIATSPNFRPVHYEAAIKAGKHVFMEKPVAVDPPGGRRIIAAGKMAKTKGLATVAGTQRRHQKWYQQQAFRIQNGLEGKIASGCIYWCGGALWIHRREPNESDADYLVRNWVSFTEMSGDHICEQHVHNIDIANWFIGNPPVSAGGFGGRARRKTGDQFDFHSVDFDYGNGIHIHSMCRQINGTWGNVSEYFVFNRTTREEKPDLKVPEFEEVGGAYQQEHADLLRSIVAEKPLNEAQNVAQATLAAIMGRISTYTGGLIRWDDLVKNENSEWYNLTLKPTAEDFETGDVKAPPDDVVAIPGKA